MAFARPTLAEIRARIQADIQTRANGGTPYLRRSFEFVLSWALAAVTHDLHGHIAYGIAQISPVTCDENQLALWGQMLNVPRKQPTASTGNYVFAGVDASVIVEGTIVQVSGNVRYETTEEVTVASGVATAPVEAVEVGAAGNTDPNTPGNLVSPVTGVQNAGAFDGDGAQGGTDIEDLEVWRQRILARIQVTPRGGTSDDYEFWARSTPGVTIRDVFVRPLRSGAGTVDVAFTVEAVDPIPSAPQLALVQDYIDSKRPVDMAGCTVYAPIAQVQDYTIALKPNTTPVQTAVLAQLDDYHNRELGMGETLLISRVDEAVSLAEGETDHLVTIPAGNVAPISDDHIILRGVLTPTTLP